MNCRNWNGKTGKNLTLAEDMGEKVMRVKDMREGETTAEVMGGEETRASM